MSNPNLLDASACLKRALVIGDQLDPGKTTDLHYSINKALTDISLATPDLNDAAIRIKRSITLCGRLDPSHATALYDALIAAQADVNRVLNPPAVVQYGRKPEVLEYWGDTFWSLPIGPAAVHVDNDEFMADLLYKVDKYGDYININNPTGYDTRFYRADETTPLVRLGFDNQQNKSSTPSWFYKPEPAPFANVPIPNGAKGAEGSDGAACFWKPSGWLNDIWRFEAHDAGWVDFSGVESKFSGVAGGVIADMNTNPGYFLKGGTTASQLPMACTNIGIDEMLRALANKTGLNRLIGFAVPAPNRGYVWPAQRGDGANTASVLVEGLRARLKASFDVAAHTCHPIQTVILWTLQSHGGIIKDKSGAVNFTTESGKPIEEETGVNPWVAMVNGAKNSEIMDNFPWDQLEFIDSDYGKPV